MKTLFKFAMFLTDNNDLFRHSLIINLWIVVSVTTNIFEYLYDILSCSKSTYALWTPTTIPMFFWTLKKLTMFLTDDDDLTSLINVIYFWVVVSVTMNIFEYLWISSNIFEYLRGYSKEIEGYSKNITGNRRIFKENLRKSKEIERGRSSTVRTSRKSKEIEGYSKKIEEHRKKSKGNGPARF